MLIDVLPSAAWRWRGKPVVSPFFSEVLGLGRCLIFLVCPTRHDLQRIIRQRSLQRLGLVSRRAHPDVALLIRHQDHRHRFGMDRLDDRVRGGR
jgi:hypothetical protein